MPDNKTKIESVFKNKLLHLGREFHFRELSSFICNLYNIPIQYADIALSKAKKGKHKKEESNFVYSIKYIERESFNAFITNEEGVTFICIHGSVPYLLFEACYNYSQLIDFEKAIPKEKNLKLLPKDIFSLKQSLDYNLLDTKSIENLFNKLLSNIENTESQTFSYAIYLYEIAIRFLIMHECMHVILGHVDYIKQAFGLNSLIEFSKEREGNIPIQISQAIELTADRNSCRGGYVQLLKKNNIYQFYSETEASFELLTSRSNVNALFVLFNLFPTKLIKDMNETLIKSHPHPYVRMQWILRELSCELIEKKQFSNYLLKPFALNLGIFKHNFQVDYDWIKLSENDFKQLESKDLFSDLSYTKAISICKILKEETKKFHLNF